MGTPYVPRKATGSQYPFPSYFDLGKDCRTLFTNGYCPGEVKINVKNLTCHQIELCTSGTHNIEEKTAKGDVSVKTQIPPPSFLPQLIGLSTFHKWDTNNVLRNELIFQDTFLPGLKLTTGFLYDFENNIRSGDLKVQQKHALFTLDAAVNGGDDDNLKLGGSLVTGYKSLMGAYKIDFDTSTRELKSNNLGAAYLTKDYSFFIAFNQELNKEGALEKAVQGYFHHRINRELELAVQAKVSGQEGGTQLGIAGRYMFSQYGHALRAKVNNQSILGLGLELKIIPGWQFYASTDVDLKKFSEGNHKVGFQLDFGLD